jgi:hypothetical protein
MKVVSGEAIAARGRDGRKEKERRRKNINRKEVER